MLARPLGRVSTNLPSTRRNCRDVTPYPKSTFDAADLVFAILTSLLAHRAIYRYVISRTNRGVLEQSEETASIKRATAQLTTRFSASETNVLRERELQNRCALHLSVLENTRDNPRARKRKRPVTPCVPARLDRRYFSTVLVSSSFSPL
jgi:hypothetical protein